MHNKNLKPKEFLEIKKVVLSEFIFSETYTRCKQTRDFPQTLNRLPGLVLVWVRHPGPLSPDGAELPSVIWRKDGTTSHCACWSEADEGVNVTERVTLESP